jgi:hypothetical protein
MAEALSGVNNGSNTKTLNVDSHQQTQKCMNCWNFLLCGVVAVLEVRLWYYRKNRGCILNKGGCLNYRRTCILYRGYCLLYRGTCLIYKGSCKFTAVVAYLKNMRFRRLNRNRGFGYCLAVWCGCGAILFKCG